MALGRMMFGSAAVLAAAMMMTHPVDAQETQTAPAAGSASTTTQPAPELSKKELKEQRRQQKAQEKAANQNAQAQRDQANALKHQDAAQNAAQKAAATPSTPPQ